MHSEIDPACQNPIQRTVRTAHLSMLMTVHNMTVHNCRTWTGWAENNPLKFLYLSCGVRDLKQTFRLTHMNILLTYPANITQITDMAEETQQFNFQVPFIKL